MKSSFCIDLQRFMLIPTKFPLSPSMENAEVHMKRVYSFLPEFGKVGVMCITDKQFGNIKLFYGKKPQKPNAPGQQLELF